MRRWDIRVKKGFFNQFPNGDFAYQKETAFSLLSWVQVTGSDVVFYSIIECNIMPRTLSWWCHFAKAFPNTHNIFFVFNSSQVSPLNVLTILNFLFPHELGCNHLTNEIEGKWKGQITIILDIPDVRVIFTITPVTHVYPYPTHPMVKRKRES